MDNIFVKCRKYRKDNKITVRDISIISGFSEWAVYKFEQGKSSNMFILLAYLHFGLTLEGADIWQALTSYYN